MDALRFDAVARSLGHRQTRRGVVGLLIGGGLGAAAVAPPTVTAKPPPRNEFGCVDVGKPCRGRDSLCCSGICKGRKPKRGKKDRSRCVAHDVGGCSLNRDVCVTGDAEASNCNAINEGAVCAETTGHAPFCANIAGLDPNVNCRDCARDADCVTFGFGPGSACVVLVSPPCISCAGINGSVRTACVPPGVAT